MTDEAPPRRSGNGDQPLPDADLDAALWPDRPPSPTRAPEAQPVSAVQPEPRPVKVTVSPDKAQRPAPATLITDPQTAAPERDNGIGAGDRTGDAVPLPPVGPSRTVMSKAPRMSARDRLRQERERQARRRLWIRCSVVGAVVIVLAAATVAGVVLLRGHAPRKVPFGYAGPYAPVTLNADNSVTMAQPGVTKPVLDVYEDFQCRVCRAFEQANGGMIQRLAYRGKLKVVYFPFTIFNGQPQQANSVRAWAAARCAPPGRWARYHRALYANQPPETTVGGFPVSLLVRLGKKAGIASPAFAQCVRSQEYAIENAPLSDQIINSGVSRMPTLTLNGRVLRVSPTSPGLRNQILFRA